VANDNPGDFFAGVGLVSILVFLAWIVWYVPYLQDWQVAEKHCQTLGHTTGWWDKDAKRIRCVDVIERNP
jgi:hypothetical protein